MIYLSYSDEVLDLKAHDSEVRAAPKPGIVIPKILRRGTTEPTIFEKEKLPENVNQKKSEQKVNRTVSKQSLNCKDKGEKDQIRIEATKTALSENTDEATDSIVETNTRSGDVYEKDSDCHQACAKQRHSEEALSQFVPVISNSRVRFTISNNHYLRRGHYQYHSVFRSQQRVHHHHTPSNLQYVILHHPIATRFSSEEHILVQTAGRVRILVFLIHVPVP